MAARPPSMGVADADTSSPAVKKRMPTEIKHKLAKVARLAHAIHGKISKELVNRLMSIVGHLIQLRSLRAMEQQQVGESDDFQESGTKEKEILKRRISMDDALEDKICNLYDLFIEGLDEDAGPQVRKLYAELAEMWPQGFMDNHGIRGAVCRAKDRRKALNRHKGEEKLKRKRTVTTKTNTIDNKALTATNQVADMPKQENPKANNQIGVVSVKMLVKKSKRKADGMTTSAINHCGSSLTTGE